jgi:nitrate reductase gamma subunit
MHVIYNIVSGPLVWVAFIIFIGGSLYRLISIAVLAKKKDYAVYEYWNNRYALRSVSHWITPYATVNMRQKPMMTFVTFVFHLCAILSPLFLYAHIDLVRESWGISWGYFADTTIDMMTILVIASCIFFMVRRWTQPEVRYLTSTSDIVLLILVAMPFITGFWAYHQWIGARVVTILHMLFGEILLAAIPFTRLSHMLFFYFTRGYIGSEFGAIRHARDW